MLEWGTTTCSHAESSKDASSAPVTFSGLYRQLQIGRTHSPCRQSCARAFRCWSGAPQLAPMPNRQKTRVRHPLLSPVYIASCRSDDLIVLVVKAVPGHFDVGVGHHNLLPCRIVKRREFGTRYFLRFISPVADRTTS